NPYQTIVFPNEHSAKLIKVSLDTTPEQATFKLPLSTPRPLIMVSGDTQSLDESVQQRLVQLFSRGLAKTAINLKAVLMDNGKTSDLVTLIGQSVADREYKSPLIGVAAATQVTYPSQEEEPIGEEPTPLDPNHTHFVLVNTQNDRQAMEFRYRLGSAIAYQKSAVLILANGGKESQAEILQAVRLGWSIITLTGTGQLADEIADLSQNPPDFIPDPELAEIIADGHIVLFPVDGDIEELERLIFRQLRGDNTLKLAWQQFAIYDKNATQQQKWYHRLQLATIIFAVLGTALALLQATLDLQLQQSKTILANRSVVEDACYHEDSKAILGEYNKKVDKFCAKVLVKKWCQGRDDAQPAEAPENFCTNQGQDDVQLAQPLKESLSLVEKFCQKENQCQDDYPPAKPPEELLRRVLVVYHEANEIARYLSKNETLANYTDGIITFLQWVIVAIPIIITFLIGILKQFSHGQKWISLRSSAENLKSEIFRYRTKTGIYSDKDRETQMAGKVQELNNHLMQTEVKLSALKNYTGSLPPQYSTAGNDNGFTMLSPERYLNLRLEDQLSYYQRKTAQLDRQLSYLQWTIYGLGGVGTLLAARQFELWIALTTGLVAALTTYLGYQQVEERLQKYNQTSINLTNILNWWNALSASEQVKPENIDQLISDTETALGNEFNEWTKQMQETMMALQEKQAEAEEKAKAAVKASSPKSVVQSPSVVEQVPSLQPVDKTNV
ncbi:MAG: hypothetical protein DRR19_31345, partial [Candidatus Parabeggiatoa sp. nov. 1]